MPGSIDDLGNMPNYEIGAYLLLLSEKGCQVAQRKMLGRQCKLLKFELIGQIAKTRGKQQQLQKHRLPAKRAKQKRKSNENKLQLFLSNCCVLF